jgi:hypothetical protein
MKATTGSASLRNDCTDERRQKAYLVLMREDLLVVDRDHAVVRDQSFFAVRWRRGTEGTPRVQPSTSDGDELVVVVGDCKKETANRSAQITRTPYSGSEPTDSRCPS